LNFLRRSHRSTRSHRDPLRSPRTRCTRLRTRNTLSLLRARINKSTRLRNLNLRRLRRFRRCSTRRCCTHPYLTPYTRGRSSILRNQRELRQFLRSSFRDTLNISYFKSDFSTFSSALKNIPCAPTIPIPKKTNHIHASKRYIPKT
jgi:hypothetical protein